MNQKINLNYKLEGIELLNSEVNFDENLVQQKTLFDFNVFLEQKFDSKKELIFVVCDISTSNSRDNSKILGRVRSSLIFKVGGLGDYVTGDKVDLPKEFIKILNSIAISTTRGLMFSSFRGTFLHRAILPIVDPGQFESQVKH